MIPLRSSNLRAVRYDLATARLTVEFRSRNSYQYSPVPVAVFVALLRADSHGKYFHTQIQNRYSCRKISK